MSISIISSLYHSDAHLSQFTQSVFTFAQQIHQAGIEVHYLPILNDASPSEREQIDALTKQITDAGYGVIMPQYVERETLYASWNRGIHLSQTPYFTFWNADDVRDATAFIEGYRALQNGANLVDFRFTGVKSIKRFGLLPTTAYEQSPMLYHPMQFTRKNGVGPFFMASKTLYQQVGQFDENFQIAGDMQWAGRTQPFVKFYPAKGIGGYFYIHGNNLSNSGTNREDIEVNLIFMRRQDWGQLILADPTAMREAWETWGNIDKIVIPDETADFLWGESAGKRWQHYQSERNQAGWIRRLRRSLAVRGLIHSAEWAVHQRNQKLKRH